MTIMLEIEWINRMLTAEYPLIIQRWVFPLVTSLLSLSLPLLVGQIHRVDERYGKKGVGDVFAHTIPIRCYEASIAFIVISLVLYLLQLPRPSWIDLGDRINYLIDHSSELLVIFASFLFLGCVIWVVFFLLEYAMNTEKMYELFSDNFKKYIKAEGTLYKNHNNSDDASKNDVLKEDAKIASKNNLKSLFAIISTAIQEKNTTLFNNIYSDLYNGVTTYRNTVYSEQRGKRHFQIEYPNSFLNALCDLSQCCFEKDDISIQHQVYSFVCTALIDSASDMYECPKCGISESSLDALWLIVMDATNRKRNEFVKLYWASIFEYMKQMFHAYIVIDKNLSEDYQRYNLTREDHLESALIANIHFMWMAYIYNKRYYEILKDVLEYYNGYRDIPELNFLFIEQTLINYDASLLNSIDNTRYNSIDTLIRRYHYYATIATSEIEKQRHILADFVSFVVHLYYNRWESVPIMPRELTIAEGVNTSLIEVSLKRQRAIFDYRFDGVCLDKCMNDDEIDSFMTSILKRNQAFETAILQSIPIGRAHLYFLFRQIKSWLSWNLNNNEFVWLNALKGNVDNRKKSLATVLCTTYIPKNKMVFCGSEFDVNGYGIESSKRYLNAINVQVAKEYYCKQRVQAEYTNIDMLREEVAQMSHDNKYILFYSSDEQLRLFTSMQFSWDDKVSILSNREFSIKCVLLSDNDKWGLSLINQLWIIPRNEQPLIRLIEDQNTKEWTTIHDYAKGIVKYRDMMSRQFEKMPIYVKISDYNVVQNIPMISVALKCKMEIYGKEYLNAKVLLLGDPDIAPYRDTGEQRADISYLQRVINYLTHLIEVIKSFIIRIL